MDCLKGYIGLSAQVATVESNLYVVTLPGISLFNLTKIADKTEQISEGKPDPKIVFNECEDRAIQTFISAFTAQINECYHLSDLDIIHCLLCENRAKLGVALQYFIGHELMIERTSSDRLNRFTTIDRDKAIELRSFFIERGEYELSLAVKGINPNKSDCVDSPIQSRFPIKVLIPIM